MHSFCNISCGHDMPLDSDIRISLTSATTTNGIISESDGLDNFTKPSIQLQILHIHFDRIKPLLRISTISGDLHSCCLKTPQIGNPCTRLPKLFLSKRRTTKSHRMMFQELCSPKPRVGTAPLLLGRPGRPPPSCTAIAYNGPRVYEPARRAQAVALLPLCNRRDRRAGCRRPSDERQRGAPRKTAVIRFGGAERPICQGWQMGR